MKKILSYMMCLAAILFVACAKDGQEVQVPKENITGPADEGYSITAYVVEGDVTKTSYAGERTFSWTGDEIISMQLIKKTATVGTRDRWLFYNSSTAGTTANFRSTGTLSTSDWALSTYAFYPAKGNDKCPTGYKTWDVGEYMAVNSGDNEARAGKVEVSDYVKASVSNPMQYIPLIGVRDGSGNYAFHTATGILKITVSNIDERLAKVQLYSEGQKLNGTYTLTGSEASAYIAMTTTSTAGEQLYNVEYTDRTDETELPFYFPVPVGDLNGGFQIRLLDSVDDVFFTATAPAGDAGKVNIERNKISEITAKISLPAKDYRATVTVAGTSLAPTATVAIKDATSVKMVLAASQSAGESKLSAPDASVIAFANGETKAIPLNNVSTSGQYFLVAKTFDGEEAKLQYNIPVYCLAETDATRFCKQHTDGRASTDNKTYDLLDRTITFAVSDNPLKGNIIMTEFDGMSYNAAPTTGARFYTVASKSVGLSFSSGTPFYGKYTPSSGFNAINLVFASPNDAPFFTYDGINYRLCASATNSEYWNFCLNRNTGNYYIRNWNEPTYLRNIGGTESYTYSYWFEAYHYDSYGTY